MNVIKTALQGVVILEPRVFEDGRGYFFESFNQREFDEEVALPLFGRPMTFVQDNQSRSSAGVVRGLHYQRPPFAQSKLVRCISGSILDVAVDIRRGSPTYLQHVAVELSAENRRCLLIPKGFAHGFSVPDREAVVLYKCDEFYHPEADAGIQALDPRLGIDWRVNPEEAVLSDKDRQRLPVQKIPCDFEY